MRGIETCGMRGSHNWHPACPGSAIEGLKGGGCLVGNLPMHSKFTFYSQVQVFRKLNELFRQIQTFAVRAPGILRVSVNSTTFGN